MKMAPKLQNVEKFSFKIQVQKINQKVYPNSLSSVTAKKMCNRTENVKKIRKIHHFTLGEENVDSIKNTIYADNWICDVCESKRLKEPVSMYLFG